MSQFEIIGQKELFGEVKIQGSKNATLPVIAATVLNKGVTRLTNCPRIVDVEHMLHILQELGCTVIWEEKNTVVIDATEITVTQVPTQYVGVMRSSILFLGALLGRCHEVTIAYPGGCSIGQRKIDYHLDAFKKMMVQVDGEEKDNLISCRAKHIYGTDIFLKFPSVGATQNIILASVLALGTTKIFNAAREPEVATLCNFLVSMGANIHGIGEGIIEIEGVKKLHGTTYHLPPDRIVAGTYMCAAMMTGGEVKLYDVPVTQLKSVCDVLQEIGCQMEEGKGYLKVRGNREKKAISVLRTTPYPGFPTDMQSQLLAILSVANGTTRIEEKIFESRYKTAYELIKMGADITIIQEDQTAIVRGVSLLRGCDVEATDLRGGAAMVIAALYAEGMSRIFHTEYIMRGYEDMVSDLQQLGADIR